MSCNRHTVGQIMTRLREADVALRKGQPVVLVCRPLGITQHMYYRWRNEYGGRKIDRAKRLKDLEAGERPAQAHGGLPHPRQADPEGSRRGKLLSHALHRKYSLGLDM